MARDPENKKRLSRRDFVKTAGAGVGAAALSGLAAEYAEAQGRPPHWDKQADIVVVGAGAAGLPAAIEASENGASVILMDANFDIGGHGMVSGGNVALGGGTSRQKKYGVEDSADLLFADLTDWSVVEPNGFPDYRYNDKEVIRAFADNSAPTFEWLVAHGVIFVEKAPDNLGAGATGNSALRENHAAPMGWTLMQTGKPVDPTEATTRSSGVGLVRPLEAAARKANVQILLQHKMSSLIRQTSSSGKILGIKATHEGKTLNIAARKAVILATGGSSGNVNFRRMFDVRLTDVLQVAGEPWTFQDGSGELAAMAIGASLWGFANQILENGDNIRTKRALATKYNYMTWDLESPIFPLVRATGLNVKDWQDLILVNQVGKRFYDETKGDYPQGNVYNEINPYTRNNYRNNESIKYNPTKYNFFNAAVAMNEYSEPPDYSAGPVWAIFDADAAERAKWKLTPPYVDIDGYFFSAKTLRELAAAINNPYQAKPMDGATLQATVERYNSFVDAGADLDFGKPIPRY